MVMATEIRENRNGRRSRGSSPTINKATPTVAATSDNLTPEKKIRVGKDYQAVCPEMLLGTETIIDKALLVWSPTKDIPEIKLEEYITVAKERYGYNGEQALGMLFWHKHDLEKAVLDLANFTPFPDEWTKEDKVLFEQAFQFHGKCFHRIRQMLPDKSIASLVKFYYSWKKTRSRTSCMDRQEKKKNDGGSSENGSENGSNEDSENEEKVTAGSGGMKSEGNNENKDTGYSSSSSSSTTIMGQLSSSCQNCNVLCNELKQTSFGNFCYSCYHHWRRTGALRPTTGPSYLGNNSNKRPRSKTGQLYFYHGYHDGASNKHKRKPPKGMYINHDDVVVLATQSKLEQSPNNISQFISNQKASLASPSTSAAAIQTNKQKISSIKIQNSDYVDDKGQCEQNYSRILQRWTSEEISLAVKGFQKYGKNFQAIAEMLGTKTESHVRQFVSKNRRRLNIDGICKEFEARKEKSGNFVDSSNGTKNDKQSDNNIDSDDETTLNGTNGAEKITNIDEIIGVNNNISVLSNASDVKEKSDEAAEVVKCTSTKTSIMTMSSGKTMQSHHKKTLNEKMTIPQDEDEDEVEKMDTTEDDEEISPPITIKLIDDRKIEKMDTVDETLLMATGNGLGGEITITPIVKTTDAKIVKPSVDEIRKSIEVTDESSVSLQKATPATTTTTIATSIAQPITIN
ncbi:unnamed protein product [Diamesa hyperborea]